MWNCTSPKLSFVLIPFFAAVATPSLMTQDSPPFHFDRSLPSKRTTASDGGAPGSAPGGTSFGSGQTIPLSYSCWAKTSTFAPTAAATVANTHELRRMSVPPGENLDPDEHLPPVQPE